LYKDADSGVGKPDLYRG